MPGTEAGFGLRMGAGADSVRLEPVDSVGRWRITGAHGI